MKFFKHKKNTNSRTIKFYAVNEYAQQLKNAPKPASDFIPEWWKKMSTSIKGQNPNLDIELSTGGQPITAKKCFPLLDSMTTGYIATLWADIAISEEGDIPLAKWKVTSPVLEVWSLAQSEGFEISDDCNKLVFKYVHDYIIETPQGYSCLITHPFGYPNLPFRTLTGIVDTDNLKTHINSPFVIKKGFTGIIEKGTPMFQIIPFKRDDWSSEVGVKKPNEVFYDHERLMSKISSSYGRFLRIKKTFN